MRAASYSVCSLWRSLAMVRPAAKLRIPCRLPVDADGCQVIRMEYGRSIKPRDWREFARICPRALPMGGGVVLTIDPAGVTVQSVTGLDRDETDTVLWLMDWFVKVYGYHPLWLLQTKLIAGVQ